MVDAVDVGIDQVIDTAVTFDFNAIDNLNVPFGKNQKLVQLFGEVLDSQFNGNFDGEVGTDFLVQFLDVLTLANAVRSILPNFIQRDQQFTIANGTTDGNREVLNAPVHIAKVKE